MPIMSENLPPAHRQPGDRWLRAILPQPATSPEALHGRIRLALSIIAQRSWHPDDKENIQAVTRALNGDGIEQLLGGADG